MNMVSTSLFAILLCFYVTMVVLLFVVVLQCALNLYVVGLPKIYPISKLFVSNHICLYPSVPFMMGGKDRSHEQLLNDFLRIPTWLLCVVDLPLQSKPLQTASKLRQQPTTTSCLLEVCHHGIFAV